MISQTKIEFITCIYILYCLSSINFQLSYSLAGFLDILNYTTHNGGLGNSHNAKFPLLTSNSNKQTTLLDGVDVGPPKQRVCWRGWKNRSIHEAVNNISGVKVHLKTRSGNVNIKRDDNYVATSVCVNRELLPLKNISSLAKYFKTINKWNYIKCYISLGTLMFLLYITTSNLYWV